MAEGLSAENVRADVAELLHRSADEVSDSENLFDAGLESVRIMTLLEQWRAAGADVTFVDLAERPTLGQWLELLGSRVSGGSGG